MCRRILLRLNLLLTRANNDFLDIKVMSQLRVCSLVAHNQDPVPIVQVRVHAAVALQGCFDNMLQEGGMRLRIGRHMAEAQPRRR